MQHINVDKIRSNVFLHKLNPVRIGRQWQDTCAEQSLITIRRRLKNAEQKDKIQHTGEKPGDQSKQTELGNTKFVNSSTHTGSKP